MIGRIGAIASAFGPRAGLFPLIAEYANSDNFRIEDRALFCSSGPLEQDSSVFRKIDQGHRTSPWFKVPLHLNTVTEAVERYRVWAEAQWNQTHPNPVIQQQRPDGSVAEVVLKNPFAVEEPAR